MKTLVLFLSSLCFSLVGFAGKVDTVDVYSASMKKNIKAVIIQPDHKKTDKFPTVFLLHGFGGQYHNYVNNVPKIKEFADEYGMFIVCPDGGRSWYWDIQGDQNFQYETFVSKELVQYVNKNYPVYDDAKKRAISGFSMGGHGAWYLALRNPTVFGAAASTAGGVDIRPFPHNWDMEKRLGAYAENKDRWHQHTVAELLYLVKPNTQALYIDCGRDDFFYEVNRKLHEQLTYLNIKHQYHTMPGKHDWNYVKRSILFQFPFFNDFFINGLAN